MNKKLIILVVFIAVILVAVIVLNQQASTPSGGIGDNTPADQEKKVSDTEQISQEKPEELMKAFPAGFPFEEGAESQSSYQFIPAKSTDQQNTLTYTSKKSLTENATIFKAYLDDNGFEISNKVTDKSQYFYYATKDNNDLSILVQDNEGKVTVSVSYLVR